MAPIRVDFQEPISPPDQALPIEPTSPAEFVQAPAPVVEPAGGHFHEPGRATVDLLDVLLVGLMSVIAFFVFGTIAVGVFMYTHHLQGPGTRAIEDALGKNAFFIVSTEFVTYIAIVAFMVFLVWTRRWVFHSFTLTCTLNVHD